MKNYLRGLLCTFAELLCVVCFTIPVAAQDGWSLRMEGVDARAAVEESSGLNVFPLTVTAWVRTDQTNGSVPVVVKSRTNIPNGSYRLMLQDGRLSGGYGWDGTHGVSTKDSEVGVADGVWHHLAMVVDTNTLTLFVDGNLRASQEWMTTPGVLTTSEPLILGMSRGLTNAFRGNMDEVSIWNRALSQDELRGNLFHSLDGNEPGLVAYWRMDEGTGRAVQDATGLGHHLTLVAGVVWEKSSVPSMSEVPRLPPSVQTLSPTNVYMTAATLQGLVDPEFLLAAAWFEWGSKYENRTPVQLVSGSSPVEVRARITQLISGQRHDYRLVASNELGLTYGSNQWFIPGAIPISETMRAQGVSAVGNTASATLVGRVNPSHNPTVAWFVWGPDLLCRNTTQPQYVGGGGQDVTVMSQLRGLPADEIYHYRLVSSNLLGVTIGTEQTFSAPGIILDGARVVTLTPEMPWIDPGARVSRPILSIAAGTFHVMALTYDGELLNWGEGSASNVPWYLSNVVAIAAGLKWSAARTADGKDYSWGEFEDNAYIPPGELPGHTLRAGESVASYLNSLGAAFPPWTNIVAADGDQWRRIGLTEDGRVLSESRFSIGMPDDILDPVAVASGDLFAYALQRDGVLHEWTDAFAAATDLAPFLFPIFRTWFDPSKPGVYHVIYAATNAWGNIGKETRTVIVEAKGEKGWSLIGDVLSNVRSLQSKVYDDEQREKLSMAEYHAYELFESRNWGSDDYYYSAELEPENAADAYSAIGAAIHILARTEVHVSLRPQLNQTINLLRRMARDFALARLTGAIRRGALVDGAIRVNEIILAADAEENSENAILKYRTAWHHAAELNLTLRFKVEGEGMHFTFAGVPGRRFILQRSEDLRSWLNTWYGEVDGDGIGRGYDTRDKSKMLYRVRMIQDQ